MANAGAGFGFIISSKFNRIESALAAAPAVFIPQVLLCGFLITVDSMNPPFRQLSYTVFFRYAFQAAVMNEFDCDPDAKTMELCESTWLAQGDKSCDDSPCPYCCDESELINSLSNGVTTKVCPVTTCTSALKSLGLANDDIWPNGDTPNETVGQNLFMLLGLTIFIRFLGFVVLFKTFRKMKNEGKAAQSGANRKSQMISASKTQ